MPLALIPIWPPLPRPVTTQFLPLQASAALRFGGGYPVDSLRNTLVGHTTVSHKLRPQQLAADVYQHTDGAQEHYTLKAGSRVLGTMRLETLTPETNPGWALAAQQKAPGLAGEYYGNAPEQTRFQPQVYIHNLNAPYNLVYKDIGRRLVQIALERSLAVGAQGRVALAAIDRSHGFHYKMGFRPMRSYQTPTEDPPETWTHRILDAIDRHERGHTPPHLGAVPMFLPPEAIAVWQQQIAQAPILAGSSTGSKKPVQS